MRIFKFVLTLILFLYSFASLSAQTTNFYWREFAVNNNFSNPSNWVTNPAEVSSPAPVSIPESYPQTADHNVFFTVNSTFNTLTASQVNNIIVGDLTCTAPVTITLAGRPFDIYGNIQSNGNLRVSTSTGILVSMLGNRDATIDLGTSETIAFGVGFTINKSGARIDLINNELNRTHPFTLTAGNFYANGINIAASTVSFNALPADNLTGITLNLTGTGTSNFQAGGFYDCYVISLNGIIGFWAGPTRLKSLTLNGNNAVALASNAAAVLTIDDFIINVPRLTFGVGSNQPGFRFSSITVSNTMTLQRACDIAVNYNGANNGGNITHTVDFNVNTIVVVPNDCEQRSFFSGYGEVTFNATNPITTSNLTYRNCNFTGSMVTASTADDGGANQGNVTFLPVAAPQDYYWRVGTGNWELASNWALGSFTGTAATCPPTANDNVFFGDNGGVAYTVTLNRSAACNNIAWIDATKSGRLSPVATSTAIALSIKGNADFSGASQISSILFFMGNSPTGSYTINSGSESVYANEIHFRHQGTYTLTSDFISIERLNHSSGNLISAGYTIQVSHFLSRTPLPSGTTRTLNLSGSDILLSGGNMAVGTVVPVALDRSGMTDYDFSDSHFNLLSTGNATLSATGSFDFHNITFNSINGTGTLTFTVATNTINRLTYLGAGVLGNTRGFTVDSLILSPNRTYTLPNFTGVNNEAARTVTINKELISNTTDCIGLILQGNAAATNRGMIRNNTGKEISIGASTVNNVTWIDPNYPLDVPNGTDGGGNTNVAFTDGTPKAMYWVGGTGNWSNPLNWSLNSGLPRNNPGDCLTGRTDTVYFDGGSFTAANQTVTMDITPVSIASMFWQPEAGAMTPVFNTLGRTINLSGSLRLASGMAWQTSATANGVMNFTGIKTDPYSQFIESNGVTIGSAVNFTGTGRFDLIGNYTSYNSAIVQGQVSSFYTHGFNMQVIWSLNNHTVTITQTGSNFRDLSNSVLSNGLNVVLNIADCATFLTNSTSITGGTVTISNPNCPVTFKTIQANTTLNTNVNNLVTADKILTGGTINGFVETDTLHFTNNLTITTGPTVTVHNEFMALNGTPCDLRNVMSNSATAQANLILNYCNPVVANIRLSNINVTVPDASECGGESQELLVYGVDLGGNTGNIRFSSELSPGGTVILPDIYIACPDYILNIAQGNILSYQWFRNNAAVPAARGGTGRNLWINEPGTYRLEANYGAACIAAFQKTVHFVDIYRTWLGGSTDWNDHTNWNPASVPDSCSYVIIPGGLPYYPVLVPGAVCDIIEFRFGGEVKNTNYLTYNEAKVEMALQSNQWYMLSAPLKNTYSGDYYVDNPNPIHDLGGRGMLVYMMHFNVPNYQYPGSTLIEYDWNNAFHTNDIEILPGQGFALWGNPRGSSWSEQQDISFWFAKPDAYYEYYTQLGAPSGKRGADLDRTYSHRFIYEDNNGNPPVDGLVVLNTSGADAAGEKVLVGNPFMTHLDFDLFAARNTALIYDEYRLAHGIAPNDGYVNQLVTYKKLNGVYYTSDPVDASLSNLIAPMQSFIVTSRGALTNLSAHIKDDTQTNPGNTLRSENAGSLPVLNIFASNADQKSKAIVVHSSGADNAFCAEEDSRRLFPKEDNRSVLVYTLSSDNYALDINSIDNLNEPVALGFRTARKGRITLNFSGMDDFFGKTIFLHDTKENRIINLTQEDAYSFFKMDDEVYTNDRFFISFKDEVSIEHAGKREVFISNPVKNTIRVYSPGVLETIEILDLQGRTVAREENVNRSMYSYQVNAPGVYIVRIGGETKKIIVQ